MCHNCIILCILCSIGGHTVGNDPTSHFYQATKHAVTGILEGMRHELREFSPNIRVSVSIISHRIGKYIIMNLFTSESVLYNIVQYDIQ